MRNKLVFLIIALVAVFCWIGCEENNGEDATDPTGPASGQCSAFPIINQDADEPCDIHVDFRAADGCEIIVGYLVIDTYQRATYTGSPLLVTLDPWTDVHYITADIYFSDGSHFLFDDWPGFRAPGCWNQSSSGEITLTVIPRPDWNCDDVVLSWTNTDEAPYYLYRGPSEDALMIFDSCEWVPQYGGEATYDVTYFQVQDSDGNESNIVRYVRDCPGDP